MEIFYRWTPGGSHIRNTVTPSGHEMFGCVYFEMGIRCNPSESEQFERLGFRKDTSLRFSDTFILYRR